MRYYLLVFLFCFSTQALEVDKIIDTNIKSIYVLKTFKEKKETMNLLYKEISNLKKNSKLKDNDFYVATDFLKVIDSINTMGEATVENCFNTKIEVLSEFGIRSVEASTKNLPDGAKKGILVLNILCKK